MLALKQLANLSSKFSESLAYKAPKLLLPNKSESVDKENLLISLKEPKAIRIHRCVQLRRCASIVSGSHAKQSVVLIRPDEAGSSSVTSHNDQRKTIRTLSSRGQSRRLAILFGWLMAREDHLEKYHRLYMARGFDVLTVQANLSTVGLPQFGSQVMAERLYQFLRMNRSEYKDIVTHGLSVGGYQFGEFLVFLKSELEANSQAAQEIKSSIRGMVYDSMVCTVIPGIPAAVSNLLAKGTPAAPVLEKVMTAYLQVSPATRCYAESSNVLHNMFLKCPALFLVSRDDKVASIKDNERATAALRRNGVFVTWQCWDHSDHVQHYHKYPAEYEQAIDTFLESIQLSS